MKKVLFATTALFATAGFAAAEVTLDGSANMGMKYQEDRTNPAGEDEEIFLHYEVDVNVKGVTQTDGGLELGASIDLDAEIEPVSGDANSNTVNDPEVYVKGAFGTVTVGDLDVATDGLGMSDLGFDGIGLDDQAEEVVALGLGIKTLGSANASYANTFGDISVLVTTHTVNEDFALMGKYDNGTYNVGLGYASDDDFDADSWTLSGGGNFGQVSVEATYTSADVAGYDGDAYGLFASYDMNNGTVISAGFADNEAASDASFGVGGSYDLGGGAELAGAIGSIDDRIHADLGVSFDF